MPHAFMGTPNNTKRELVKRRTGTMKTSWVLGDQMASIDAEVSSVALMASLTMTDRSIVSVSERESNWRELERKRDVQHYS